MTFKNIDQLKQFNKYKTRGAYHWQWYKTNKHLYRDYAFQTLSYFPNPGSLIDIGCGDGLLSYLFFKRGFKVTGIDPDKIGIDLGRKEIVKQYFRFNPIGFIKTMVTCSPINYLAKKGIQLNQLSIYDVDGSNRYDYAICMEVIEHVPNPKLLIDKLLNVTKKYAIISTPNADFCEPEEEDYQFWTPQEFINMLGNQQAQLIDVSQRRIFAKLSM